MDQRSSDSIIPRPQVLRMVDGLYRLSDRARIACDASLRSAGEWFAGHLRSGCGWQAEPVGAKSSHPLDAEGGAEIRLREDEGIQAEGYRLAIERSGVTVRASTPAGAFYAMQSLRQLLPPAAERVLALGARDESLRQRAGSRSPHPPIDLPCLEIVDFPRFPWRGAHLDVARHFFSVEEVKRFLELLALFKLNRFHWHLTDDQGWRIEIKSRPRLTEVGSKRINQDGSLYGGFYTQEEIREVVDWAAERGIAVVPEIEMPGHSQAAVASYPELACAGAPEGGWPGAVPRVAVWNRWGVSGRPLCPGNEATYRFLAAVLDEVMPLFPAREVHVGGDECPTETWRRCPACRQRMLEEGLSSERALQGYLLGRVQRHLAERGRRLVGWDEILAGELDPGAVVMSWRGVAGGIEAARRGHEVVMTPEEYCYLDHRQSTNPGEPGPTHFNPPPLTLEHLYSFEPIPAELALEDRPRVIGAQGNLWSEAIDSLERLDYMAFPRLIAMAEVVWSAQGRRDFSSFKSRLRVQQERLDRLGVGSCRILESL